MKYAELKKSKTDAVDHKTATAETLAMAQAEDQDAQSEVTRTDVAYAQAVFAAPGHTVVYLGPPLTLDQSVDGVTVTTITVAASTDPTDGSTEGDGEGPPLDTSQMDVKS